MQKYLKKLAAIGIVLYMAQAMVGVYYGIQIGIQISKQMHIIGEK